MTRFMVVRHPVLRQRVCVHAWLHSYHWESLDSEHVLLLGGLPARHLHLLDNHVDVLVVPSVYSTETIHGHAMLKDKAAHFLSLKRLGISETHRTVDLAQMAAQHFGVKFQLDL